MKQDVFLAVLISGALAFVIGFAGGAILTRPNRIIVDQQKYEYEKKVEQANNLIKLNRKLTVKNQELTAENNRLKSQFSALKDKRLQLAKQSERNHSNQKNKEVVITKKNPKTKIIDCPAIGERGYISAFHTLGISKQAQDELIQSGIAGDKIGYQNLLLSGRAFILPEKTHVLVIDRGWFIRKIRILEGPYKNQTGWIAYERIHKSK